MPANHPERRVLILAPLGQDAAAMAALLQAQQIDALVCCNPGECLDLLSTGAGALLLTEEALELPRAAELIARLKRQPAWSDLPLIILTSGGELRVNSLLDLVASSAGSVTLLERPMRAATLLRSVQVALQARRRQYQVRDLIDQQQRDQRQLRESEDRVRQQFAELEAIYRTAPLGLAVLDTDLRFRRINERLAQFNGRSAEEHIGKTFGEVVPSLAAQAEQVLRRVLETGQFVRFEFRGDIPSQPGVERIWDESWYPLRDASGEIAAVGVVAEEITERKRVEAALARAQQALRQHASNLETMVAERTADLRASNEQLETFVYSVAHDLRAPLRSMAGYAQLLLDEYAADFEESAQHMLRRIEASAEFMDKLLLDLLAYGRTARADIELTPVHVGKAWETALFQCATQIEQTDAQVETAERLPKVLAHESTLGQVLANLLSNALRFTAPGVQPHIRFWAEENSGQVRLWIQDNGIGIPAEHHERVFRVFERLNGSRYPGTGIGLSMVRKGVERMEGTVGLESEPGKGTRFWIQLAKAPV